MAEPKPKRDIVVALAGTPNVGKSAIFHQMTGVDVIVSNYPGTTVELLEGRVKHSGREIRVIDLPGVYSLGAVSEDEVVTRRAILDFEPDVIVNVVDASNLERSLYLSIQLLELGRPMLMLLNMYDVATAKGIKPDPNSLSKKLGVPVIATVATRGENIAEAFNKTIEVALKRTKPSRVISTGKDTEAAIAELAKQIRRSFSSTPFNLPPRSLSVKLLEGDSHLIEHLARVPGSEQVLKKAGKLARDISRSHGEPSAHRIARERHSAAALIARGVTKYIRVKSRFSNRLGALLTDAKTGIPIMALAFVSLLLLIIYVGGFLESLFLNVWDAVTAGISVALRGSGAIGQIINIGLIQGIAGILAVMIPYILIFFLAMGFLEDVGYLPRMAFVMDSAMHKIGLHGRAVVPMLGGFGCNVPAIMSTRVLTTRRERLISSFLITMVPCSARTAVILGTVGVFLGVKYAFFIYAIILALIFISGWILNRFMSGQVSGMVMEMPPLRRPLAKPLLSKTWLRMKGFILFATPLLLFGSFIIGILQVSGAMSVITEPLSPLTTGWLGLPAVAIIPLIYGFVRKEGALVLLVALAGTSDLSLFMSPLQLFVFALVVTIYVPCLATIAVLKKELGVKTAAAITISTFLISLLLGGAFYHLNPLGL